MFRISEVIHLRVDVTDIKVLQWNFFEIMVVIQTGIFNSCYFLCKERENGMRKIMEEKREDSEYCINTDVNPTLISIFYDSDFTCSQKKISFLPNALSHHIRSSPWLL